MKSCCKENNCIKCCLETRMPLSNQDIERIKMLGFNTKFFITSKKGWLQLKNKNGKCIFHNGILCTIYKDRPEGCRLYPIIYDKNESIAIFDKDCPYKDNFKISKGVIKKLYALVSKLEHEKAQRKSKTNRLKSIS